MSRLLISTRNDAYSALQLLVDMSQEHQVLMFTCSDSVRVMVAEMPLLGDDVADIGILNLSQG